MSGVSGASRASRMSGIFGLSGMSGVSGIWSVAPIRTVEEAEEVEEGAALWWFVPCVRVSRVSPTRSSTGGKSIKSTSLMGLPPTVPDMVNLLGAST